MARTYRVIVLPRAFDDIDGIIDYIKRDSPQNAARVIDRLWRATRSLSVLPRLYKVYKSSRDPDLVVRSMPVPPHIIYFRVLERIGVVRVLTIQDGRRLQPKHFPED